MIQSMTGFSEKRFSSRTLSAKFNIRTFNHRFLDWSYRGAQIGEVESGFRAICQRRLHRGRIEASLELSFLDPSSWDLWINEELLLQIISSLEGVSSRIKKNVSISTDNVFNIPHVIELKRKDFSKEEKIFLERSFEKTLEGVLKMRRREGKEIKKEIGSRLLNITRAVTRIEKGAENQPFLIQEKLKQRLRELSGEHSLSDERLAEEAAYLAQRYDLHEEVARLKCHLDYMRELLSPAVEEPVGRKLDFVAQELYREANTINSKSQDMKIIKECLAVKGDIESIRQQVQNIE